MRESEMARIDPIQQQILDLQERICDEMQDLEMQMLINELTVQKQKVVDLPFLKENLPRLIEEGVDPEAIIHLYRLAILKDVLGGNTK